MTSCLFQGKSMLDTCSKAFKNQQMTLLLDKLQCFHLPVVYGAICGIMELDIQSTLTTFLYSTLRTSIASSIRLDKVGPIEVNINYYYTLHIVFHYIKVIRQFRCFADEGNNLANNPNIYNVEGDNWLQPGLQHLTTRSVLKICVLLVQFRNCIFYAGNIFVVFCKRNIQVINILEWFWYNKTVIAFI